MAMVTVMAIMMISDAGNDDGGGGDGEGKLKVIVIVKAWK